MQAPAATYPPTLLKMLAHDLRWEVIAALAYSDRRVQELVEILGRPMNLISYHLRQLREHDLVSERRSAADARDHYYSLDLEKFRDLYFAAAGSIHPALDAAQEADDASCSIAPVNLPPTRVLFLCTHNSARSQMAEAILRDCGNDQVEVYSAGTEPGQVHPYAVRTMLGMGIDISGQRSTHLNEFVGQKFDYVITVCDRARESCPVFPGDPERIHWSFPDPSAVEGSEAQKMAAFTSTARQLATRIRHLTTLIERNRKEQQP
jgi:ArsR family transcriptional regulator, arsenate/arsenite/antimonite-responsive transcriptional repressor / arsenate reductase (thioredoxin)